jgi:hypothetical protein
MVGRFLCYLRASVPETQIPEAGLIARPQRRRPYIFTQQELISIFEAAAAMRPRRTLRPPRVTVSVPDHGAGAPADRGDGVSRMRQPGEKQNEDRHAPVQLPIAQQTFR